MNPTDIREQIDRLTNKLQQMQQEDGSWRLCFETSPMTDAYMILLLRSLRREEDEPLIQSLARRMIGKQEANGVWKLFHDERDGNLEATVEAYYALLTSRYYDKNDARLQKAKRFILSHGGLAQVKTMLTQAILAITGQSPWPDMLRIPIEIMLAPSWFGISIYDLSGHARVHLIPILIMANAGYSLPAGTLPDISDLYVGEKVPFEESAAWISSLHKLLAALPFLHAPLEEASLRKAEAFLLDRVEPDGTLLTYSTATILMIFALVSRDYPPNAPLIVKALNGLNTLICWNREEAHLQVSTSTVWDTAMLSQSLQQAGMPKTHPAIRKAAAYLIPRQQTRYGDWAIRCPQTPPGGWGFSNVNTQYPDLDDTTATMRAIRPFVDVNAVTDERPSWRNALRWVLAMQNENGGWSSFEREPPLQLASLFQFESAEDIVVDLSTVDLTARTLQFLGEELQMAVNRPVIQKAAQWIIDRQEADGSWFGRWGICYIHGSSAAVTGLLAVGLPKQHQSIDRAVRWILSIQNDDGGWGESCYSDMRKRYVPLGSSTPSQTAWALDLLIRTHDQPTEPINRGMTRLAELLHARDWRYDYPTGAGLPGSVYVNYHSSNYMWPLLTFSAYSSKYGASSPL